MTTFSFNIWNFFNALAAQCAPDQSFANARGTSGKPRSGKWLLED